MACFEVDFLGCKVSHVDAQEIRERLLADGHIQATDGTADVAVISTCCVTNEALAKSRKAAARAARTHRRVYVTGCGANLAHFKCPRRIQSIEALPRTATGKIQKNVLRDKYWSDKAKPVG